MASLTQIQMGVENTLQRQRYRFMKNGESYYYQSDPINGFGGKNILTVHEKRTIDGDVGIVTKNLKIECDGDTGKRSIGMKMDLGNGRFLTMGVFDSSLSRSCLAEGKSTIPIRSNYENKIQSFNINWDRNITYVFSPKARTGLPQIYKHELRDDGSLAGKITMDANQLETAVKIIDGVLEAVSLLQEMKTLSSGHSNAASRVMFGPMPNKEGRVVPSITIENMYFCETHRANGDLVRTPELDEIKAYFDQLDRSISAELVESERS